MVGPIGPWRDFGYTTPEDIIEGVAIPDNREQRFEEIARNMVEGTTEFEWEEVPPLAQQALLVWIRDMFHWAIDRQ